MKKNKRSLVKVVPADWVTQQFTKIYAGQDREQQFKGA